MLLALDDNPQTIGSPFDLHDMAQSRRVAELLHTTAAHGTHSPMAGSPRSRWWMPLSSRTQALRTPGV